MIQRFAYLETLLNDAGDPRRFFAGLDAGDELRERGLGDVDGDDFSHSDSSIS